MRRTQERLLLVGLVVLMGAVLATGCASGESSKTGTPTNTESERDQAPSTAKAPEHALGEAFEVNGLGWTVVDSERLREVESMFSDTPPHRPSKGTWLIVTLEFRGKEGTAGGYDTAALKVRDAAGTLYDVAEPSGAADDYRLTHKGVKNLSLAMLGDANPQRVFAIYDVPESGGPFTLEWMGVEDGSLVSLARVQLSE